ncbi:MAG TPA: RNA polymerase sigma factor [Bryobacteraceae bacterium]|nr:RNA polymerase sigma factor [Bryobacteraceae bacterium]
MDREVELSLLRRLRDADTEAFDQIYDAFKTPLYSFLARLSGSGDVAEDLAEETWLRLVSASATLDPDTRFAPWLFTVARNLYVSYCRSRGREQSWTSDLLLLWPDRQSPSPFDAALSNESEDRLNAALAALPVKYREALLLVGVEGLRPAEAAAVCGISPEAFRQRLSRARALLSEKWRRDMKEAIA